MYLYTAECRQLQRTHVFVENQVGMPHGDVGLRHEAAERAMSCDEFPKLFVADHVTLGVTQRARTCVLAVNQQTLEHLYT